MKYLNLTLLLFLLGILCFSNCKKKDKDKTEESGSSTPIIMDPPPADGDYWLSNRNTNRIYWTKDFTSYHQLSSGVDASGICLSRDTAIFFSYTDHSLTYGSVSNPAGLKKIGSSRSVSTAAYINGYIVALAQDGNNNYIGYCNTKKGETDLKYTFLQNESYSGLYRVRNQILTTFSTNMGKTLAYSFFSNDTLKWMLAPSPQANASFPYYDGGNGITVAYNGSFYKTSSADLNNATWTSQNIYNVNTSDSAGGFNVYSQSPASGNFININGKWKLYGYISMTSNGHKIHAVNTSTDQGATWQTTLLSGIPYLTNSGNGFYYVCLASKNATFIMCSNNNGTNSTAFVYKSNDGINFTQQLSGAEAQTLYSECQGVVYVK